MCCHLVSPSWNACHQLGHSPKRRPRTRCHITLVWGQEEDWSDYAPWGACFQWEGPNSMEESSKFHGSPRCPLSVLHTQMGEWGSTTLCSAKGTLDCCLKWVSLRCRTPRPWPYSILTTRMFLVARNGQTDETNYEGLHMLPSIWGWLSQGPFMPYFCYCSPGSPTYWLYKYWDHVGAKPIT